MSIRLALEKVRDLAVSTTPTTMHGDYPAKFHHEPDYGFERLPSTRGLWLEVDDGARRGPYTTGRRAYLFNASVAVHYPLQADAFEREVVMLEDATRLSQALLDDTQWDELTTGLSMVSGGVGDEQDTILPIEREETEDGGVVVRIGLVLEVYE